MLFCSIDTVVHVQSFFDIPFFYPEGSALALTPSSKSDFNTFPLKEYDGGVVASELLGVIKFTATSNHPLQLCLTGASSHPPYLSDNPITHSYGLFYQQLVVMQL